jgi:ABC-type Mn2+/Zn2+ transport system ATPase subunit
MRAPAMRPAPDLLLLDEPVSAVDPAGLSIFYRMVGDLRSHLEGYSRASLDDGLFRLVRL